MPPNSHSIFDEGAVFMSFKLVDNGIFQEGGKVLSPVISDVNHLEIVVNCYFCLVSLKLI